MINSTLNIDNSIKEFDWKTAEYPIIGISKTDNLVVLFSKYEEGTVINGEGVHRIAEHLTYWDMNCFRPIQEEESITLKNGFKKNPSLRRYYYIKKGSLCTELCNIKREDIRIGSWTCEECSHCKEKGDDYIICDVIDQATNKNN